MWRRKRNDRRLYKINSKFAEYNYICTWRIVCEFVVRDMANFLYYLLVLSHYKIPESRKAFWRMVSLTAANTSRI